MEAMLKIMSGSRFEAFAAIVERRPVSVYDLDLFLIASGVMEKVVSLFDYRKK